jgi:hypothetical protein
MNREFAEVPARFPPQPATKKNRNATEAVVAIGKVDTSSAAVRVTVTELVSGKEAVDARLKQLSVK